MRKVEFIDLPNLDKARKRQRIPQTIEFHFNPTKEAVEYFKGKKYFIRTYGCQANIRDEETQKDSLTHFTLEGNLTINGGTLRVAAMGGGENPTFDVNGKVEIRNAILQTFVKTNGLIENVRMVKGRDGLNLEGTNVMQTSVSYYLQDFVEIGKDHIDYNSATQAQVDLYEYILEVKDNTLYANPRLSEIANQKNVFDLINDAKNQVAIMFYQRAKEGIGQVNKNIQMCTGVVNGYGNC